VSNPESTTILDNSTVIAPLSWLSTKRAAEDYERRISGSYPSALKAREIAARVGVASTTFILDPLIIGSENCAATRIKKRHLGAERNSQAQVQLPESTPPLTRRETGISS
jgi:hypothetical protein